MDRRLIPHELAKVLPPTVLMFWEQLWPCGKWFGIGFAVLSIYGPLFGPHGDHNGWRYLVAPLICPPFCALHYRFMPGNWYHGSFARGTKFFDLDNRNGDARRFVQLFRSPAAHSFIWRAAAKVMLIEFTAMLVATIATAATGKLGWSISSSWLWAGLLGCCIGSYIAVCGEVLAWAVATWARGDGGYVGTPISDI
jgi:hypothetical protein